MAELSAAQFIPASDAPRDIVKAVGLQAVWIEGQGKTNAAHWTKITELEHACRDCRNDRRLEGGLVMARLNDITVRLDELRADKRWAVMIVRGLFALSTLAIAAKAAGVFK